jgi:Fe-S-cluster-containing hydrogenase component 2
MPWINKDDCEGYGTCVEECPEGAITKEIRKAIIIRELCYDYKAYMGSCPNGAIALNGMTLITLHNRNKI